ncbi:hypothetical protein [Sphingomonas sp.]|uniref:hypothetical protein n=1 Tax=Sphingomonas sp. TaxID=28214 RepID=UPI0025D4DFBD|nr:hypothetical protein [Sphingomonas sp.]
MQFLRTIFWVVIAVMGVIFAVNNWTDVSIKLWSDIETVWKLPFLLLAVFLLGLLPSWILHRVTRWSLRRKLETANRSLIETRSVADGVVVDSFASTGPITVPPATTPPTFP